MKKITSVLILIISVSSLFSQKKGLINTKDISPLSIGIAPVTFFSPTDGPGIGLELNGRYNLNDKLGSEVFLRAKTIFEDAGTTYDYSGETTVINDFIETNNIIAAGVAFDYQLFNRLRMQLRGGYELVGSAMEETFDPRYIFGGGLSLRLRKSTNHRLVHYIKLAVDFESDDQFDIIVPTADFSGFPFTQNFGYDDSTINTFSIQLGWNIQLNWIKRGAN